MTLFLVTTAILLFADQVFKYASIKFIGEEVKDLFLIKISCVNKVALFGKIGNVLYILISLLILGEFIAFFFKKYTKAVKTKYNSLPFILIIAGGLSNVIDRIFRGVVIDYIELGHVLKGVVFNLADLYIVVGVFALVVIYTIKLTDKTAKNMTEGEINANSNKNIKEFGKDLWNRIKGR